MTRVVSAGPTWDSAVNSVRVRRARHIGGTGRRFHGPKLSVSERQTKMAEIDLASSPDTQHWITSSMLDDFAVLCCEHPHIELLSDPDSLSLTHRLGAIGPVAVGELVVG